MDLNVSLNQNTSFTEFKPQEIVHIFALMYKSSPIFQSAPLLNMPHAHIHGNVPQLQGNCEKHSTVTTIDS